MGSKQKCTVTSGINLSEHGQNWETETVSLEEDGERPGKRYRENAAGWKSVSV
jgi:hypothetical protein